jgi:plasmid stabilization system protein ParE
VRGRSYVLTARAEADLRQARVWSQVRWGTKLTHRYFDDLHEGAQYIARNYSSLRVRDDLAGGTALMLYPVREHYIVYEPLAPKFIAILAIIRRGRDLPSILQKWAPFLRRELAEVRAMIARGEIRSPTGRVPRSRRTSRRK